jgi:hypothetical protein
MPIMKLLPRYFLATFAAANQTPSVPSALAFGNVRATTTVKDISVNPR